MHSLKYKLSLYREGEKVEDLESRRLEIEFAETIRHGFLYYCVIKPENASGCGPALESDAVLMRKSAFTICWFCYFRYFYNIAVTKFIKIT